MARQIMRNVLDSLRHANRNLDQALTQAQTAVGAKGLRELGEEDAELNRLLDFRDTMQTMEIILAANIMVYRETLEKYGANDA